MIWVFQFVDTPFGLRHILYQCHNMGKVMVCSLLSQMAQFQLYANVKDSVYLGLKGNVGQRKVI